MLLLLTYVVIFLCFVNILFNYNERARIIRKIPGPRVHFIVGNAFELFSPADKLFHKAREYAKKYNGFCKFWAFPYAAVGISKPEDVEIIISTSRFSEKSVIYKILKPWLNEGLLLSNGEKWHQRRKILTPAFHFNILRQFCVILEENSQRFITSLEKMEGQSIDIVPVVSEFTLNSICETAMGTEIHKDINEAGKTYKKALHCLAKILLERFCRIYLYTDFMFNLSSLGKEHKKYLEMVHSFSKSVIEDRKIALETYSDKIKEKENGCERLHITNRKKRVALLDLLISSEKEGLIDTSGIQEEVDTFMFEGHDTTTSGLAFCLLTIANHEKIQDKIVTELNDIFNESHRPASMEDLPKMKYLECCIKESLRLYPPVHLMGRQLSESTKLSNYTVPAGTQCFIMIYDLHRREEWFKNPDVFDPDRFLPENCVGRHPFAYIPFSAGPRNCIGQKFAMMEMKMVVSSVLRKFKMLPVTRQSDLLFYPDLILRNKGPINITFIKR